MSENKVYTLLDKCSFVPEIPEVMSDILSILNAPGKIDKDILVTKVEKCGDFQNILLKFINSPYYDLNREIEDLKEAISYLGIQTVRNLLIAGLTKSLFPDRKGRSGLFNREKYWKHCIGTAIATDIIAQETKLFKKGALFPHGLTHDLGMVVLDVCLPNVLDKIHNKAKNENLPLIKAEQKVLNGLNHSDIGVWLTEKWDLPNNIVNVMKYHHKPLIANINEKKMAVVSVGDAISMKYYEETLDIDSRDFTNKISDKTIKSLGLNYKFLREIKSQIPRKIERVYNNINLGTLDVDKLGIS